MTKKRILPPDRLAECQAAHGLFLAKKHGLKLSQKKIADAANISPAAVNLYFKGINPLNAQFAAVLSRMLQEPVRRFSPRLADEIEGLARTAFGGEAPQVTADSPHLSAGDANTVQDILALLRKHAGKLLNESAQNEIAVAVAEGLAPYRYVVRAEAAGPPVTEGELLIAHYELRDAKGHGQLPPGESQAISSLVIHKALLRDKGVQYSAAANLALLTAWGQGMQGTINDKDPLILDRGITEFVGDGVYLLTWHDLLYIKRLQRHDADHYELISDNPKHKDRRVPLAEIVIHAKVLLAWNAQSL
ncbi:MAG: LexA family transcriptional regulator [Pseudomonas sp.]|uniref:LexA family transcriptional regulator n=1 Tax=Pseudomonas sp. TaxID=306 RepID=UPI003392D2EE